MIIRVLAIALLTMVTVSCYRGREENNRQSKPGKKELAELNKYLVQKDRERIESYISRKNLKMTETLSGLWYQINNEGYGSYFTDNDRVIIEYKCSLLDGTDCYSSKELGPREVILGRSRLEAGLDQGLRMLKPGGDAIFILPPFLAYGFPGDGNKIPSRAVIVYNVSITNK